jgi:hypothetical protein
VPRVDYTPEEAGARRGEVIVFVAWASVIGLGLAAMIIIPLVGL